MKYEPSLLPVTFFGNENDVIYIKDEERKEDFETATEIHKYMIEAYKLYSYKVCIIPKMSIDERIYFIINQIE